MRRVRHETDKDWNVTYFKYYAEFTTKNYEIIKKEFESRQIMIKAFEKNVSDLQLESNHQVKSKRHIHGSNLRERVVGKYVSYDLVVLAFLNLSFKFKIEFEKKRLQNGCLV